MPSVSKAQGRFFRMLEHNPEMAKEKGVNMTKSAMHDFAVTPEKGLPEHVEQMHEKIKSNHRGAKP